MPDRVNKNLKKWTYGERLWLTRRAVGETQKVFAKRFGVSEKRYLAAENDRQPLGGDARPLPDLSPTPGDLCALARRRHKRSLRATARMLKLSHVGLLTRERRSDERLAQAWTALGYIF